MQNFITSSRRVIKTLEHKNEEIFENIQNSNSHQVKSLHAKVTKVISNAKATYYKSKAEGSHQSNSAKWYKTIYKLAAATENQQSLSSPDHALT
jgi:beta-galactosidase beta subunit